MIQLAKIPSKEISEVVDKNMINLLTDWCRLYQENGKAFINAMIKNNGQRMAMAFVVKTAKNHGIFDECKGDFSGYVSKLNSNALRDPPGGHN